VTRYGREHLDQITTYADIQVNYIQETMERILLHKWEKDSRRNPHGRSIFRASPYCFNLSTVPAISFSLSKSAEEFCTPLIRDAENTLRDERNLPRVGEGWLSETRRFYELKAALPDDLVIHHGRPEWLGRQHLDVFLPERGVALEYQGAQHDKPIGFFGGDRSFKEIIERDKRKLKSCLENNVRLIYVREGYDLQAVLEEIKRSPARESDDMP
jgi:hypothetical protein